MRKETQTPLISDVTLEWPMRRQYDGSLSGETVQSVKHCPSKHKDLDLICQDVCVCEPSTGDMDTGESLGFSIKPVQSNW